MSDDNVRVPNGWATTTLGDVAEIIRGITFPSSEKRTAPEDGCVLCLRTSNIQESLEWDDVLYVPSSFVKNGSRWLRRFDILISMANSYELVGKVALACRDPQHVTFGGFISAIRSAGIDQKYLFYALREPATKEWVRRTASRTVNIANISIKGVNSTQLNIAPLAEQRRIVAKIEALQERSRKARAALAEVGPLLEQFRQSLLAAAFRGDLTADWRAAHPDVEPASELLARIRKERREKWEQTERAKYEAKGKTPPRGWQEKYPESTPLSEYELKDLPALPDSWCWVSVMEIHSAVDPLCYGVVQPGPEVADGAKLVRICDIEDGRIVTNHMRKIKPDIHSAYFRSQLKGSEVLVSVVGTIGRVAITDKAVVGANIARAIARITPVPEIRPEWIASVITTPRAAAWLNRGSREVARKTLNLNVLERLAVPVAPKVEMDIIIALVRGSTQAIQQTELVKSQLEMDLSQLDQSILAKAFRGELVPQDPADEPAAVLLERIRQQREAQAAAQNGQPKRRARSRKT